MNQVIKTKELIERDDFEAWDQAVTEYIDIFKKDLMLRMATEQLEEPFHIQQRLIKNDGDELFKAGERGFFPMDTQILSTLCNDKDSPNGKAKRELYFASLTEIEIDRLCSLELNVNFKESSKSILVKFKRDSSFILLEKLFNSLDRAEAFQKFFIPFLPLSRKYVTIVDASNESPLKNIKLKDIYHTNPQENSFLQQALENLSTMIPVWNVLFLSQIVNPDRIEDMYSFVLNKMSPNLPSIEKVDIKCVGIYALKQENRKLSQFVCSSKYEDNQNAQSLHKKLKKVTITSRQPFNGVYYYAVLNTVEGNEHSTINKELAKIDTIALGDKIKRNQFWYHSFLRSFQFTQSDLEILLSSLAPTFQRIALVNVGNVEKQSTKQKQEMYHDFFWYLRSEQSVSLDANGSEYILPCSFNMLDNQPTLEQNKQNRERMILAESAMHYICSLCSFLLPAGYNCEGRLVI
jgi:hypothetical protein